MCHQLQRNGPPGAVYQCTKNGWSNEDIFHVWLQHFFSHTKPSTTEHVLECNHLMSLFGPLKQAFKRECDLFIKSNSLVKITPYDLAELFNKVYSIVASIQKGVSGFRSTGIYPMNPNVFTEEDFFAANTFATDDTNPYLQLLLK